MREVELGRESARRSPCGRDRAASTWLASRAWGQSKRPHPAVGNRAEVENTGRASHPSPGSRGGALVRDGRAKSMRRSPASAAAVQSGDEDLNTLTAALPVGTVASAPSLRRRRRPRAWSATAAPPAATRDPCTVFIAVGTAAAAPARPTHDETGWAIRGGRGRPVVTRTSRRTPLDRDSCFCATGSTNTSMSRHRSTQNRERVVVVIRSAAERHPGGHHLGGQLVTDASRSPQHRTADGRREKTTNTHRAGTGCQSFEKVRTKSR